MQAGCLFQAKRSRGRKLADPCRRGSGQDGEDLLFQRLLSWQQHTLSGPLCSAFCRVHGISRMQRYAHYLYYGALRAHLPCFLVCSPTGFQSACATTPLGRHVDTLKSIDHRSSSSPHAENAQSLPHLDRHIDPLRPQLLPRRRHGARRRRTALLRLLGRQPGSALAEIRSARHPCIRLGGAAAWRGLTGCRELGASRGMVRTVRMCSVRAVGVAVRSRLPLAF